MALTTALGPDNTVVVTPPDAVGNVSGATCPHNLFLASIGTCINLVFQAALRRGRVPAEDVRSVVTGVYERDESTGRSRFVRVEVRTTVVVSEGISERRVRHLYDLACRNCPIGNTLEGARLALEEHLEIVYAPQLSAETRSEAGQTA